MSYAKAMKWQRTHPKGTRQPVIMSTGSGFWPSGCFLKENYWPYVRACENAGLEPIDCEAYYRAMLSGRAPEVRP